MAAKQDNYQRLADSRCWTHLPSRFTPQLVQEGQAAIECRKNLREDLEETYLNRRGNRRKMEDAGVNLDVLEQLVGRILHDRSIPSSTESFPSTRSPQPLQNHRNADHLCYPDPFPIYGSRMERPKEVFALATENAHTRAQFDAWPPVENWRPTEPPGAIDTLPSENEHGYQPGYEYKPIPPARYWNSSGMPRTVGVFPGETMQFPRQNEVVPLDSRPRPLRRPPHRHEDNAAFEQTTSQRGDSDARRTRGRSSNRSSGNGQAEHQVPTLRISVSANRNGGLNDDLARIQHSVTSSQPHHSQRRESNLVLEATTSEREQPNVRRRRRRSSTHETDNHQAEQQVRPRERSTSNHNTGIMNEPPRPRILDRNTSDHPLPSSVYHEQLPERHRSKSRTSISSSSRNSGAAATMHTSRNASNRTASVDRSSMSRGSDWNTESRPLISSNLDREQPPRGPPKLRRSSLSSHDSGVRVSNIFSGSSDLVLESPAFRRANRLAKKYPPTSYKYDEERSRSHTRSSRSRSSSGSRTSSHQSYDSGVCMSNSLSGNSDFVSESPALRRADRV
jgi:hypothetical protein